jgi:hypothetical protein
MGRISKMGDRANFGFKADGNNVINLYGHWAGANRHQYLAQALEASRGRWQDNGYATRIAISTIVGPDWRGQLSWGLYVNSFGDNEYPYLLVNFDTQEVKEYEASYATTGSNGFKLVMMQEPSKTWTFEQFIQEASLLV